MVAMKKTLYFDFVVAPTGGVFSTNQTYVLLGLVIDTPITTTLTVTLTQYEEFSYKASVFDSDTLGKPDIPLNCLKLFISFFLPFSIL